MAEIVLVGSDWSARALLRAQLEEEGYRVQSFETLQEVLAPLRLGLLAPQLLVLDTIGQHIDKEDLGRLGQAAGDVPVLIVTGPFDAARLDFETLGFPHVLRRPVFIRDVVAEVNRLLKRGTPDA